MKDDSNIYQKKQSKKKHFWVPPNSVLLAFISETKTSGNETTTT